ncbi:GMC oxidoreductase [Rufibacter aurantiacus]|uniref:GMC oxidoreductase n=1 Tax=Rufibacter aurantiacus TaxID=2817374 RepID=UPI001B3119C5|nr:GMC oxidoreductase [Rufibacter aurantiacus]
MKEEFDVCIAGAGIVACTFARQLVDAGLNVIMIDAGAQHSKLPGENLKNFPTYQVDVDQFGGIVRGLMHPVCVAPADKQAEYTRNALNPNQNPSKNLPGAVAAYAVGGMAVHWTCAIPRFQPVERISSKIIPNYVQDELYTEAEKLLNLHTNVHNESVRHRVLEKVLAKYRVESTPLAAKRINKEYVRYTGADTVLGELAIPGNNKALTLLQEHRVTKLITAVENGQESKIVSAQVRDLQSREDKEIKAKVFIVAAGWLHTAQILWNSGVHTHEDSALGKYLTDHILIACQVVLKQEIIDLLKQEVESKVSFGSNPEQNSLGIPMLDPNPHLHIPVTEEQPWHGQVFREAFQFDPLAPNIDSRLIVDLKWFGMVDPVRSNRVKFEVDIYDRIGMPQPTFEFELSASDKEREERMIAHMVEVAHSLGDFIPGSEPRRIPLGGSTHPMGATRMGDRDDSTSVVDSYSKVWGYNNLYVGGNNVIPTANATNPTLTSVALAIRAAKHILSNSAVTSAKELSNLSAEVKS